MHSSGVEGHLDTHLSLSPPKERSKEQRELSKKSRKQILISAIEFLSIARCELSKAEIAHVTKQQSEPVESKITINMTCRNEGELSSKQQFFFAAAFDVEASFLRLPPPSFSGGG
jgi:hypothetical protein